LECAFGIVGKILMSRISWNLFGKIWIQNVGDIDFKVNSAFENSNKFQKTKFWKEKSVENVDEFTLGPTAQATLAYTKKTLEIYQNDGFETYICICITFLVQMI
jgi:hypothetical protein